MQDPSQGLPIVEQEEKETNFDIEIFTNPVDGLSSDDQKEPPESVADTHGVNTASNEPLEEISDDVTKSNTLPVSIPRFLSSDNNRFSYPRKSGRTMNLTSTPISKQPKLSTPVKSKKNPENLAVNLSDDTHHIKIVRFLDSSDNSFLRRPAIFENASPWQDIPQFVIVTGQNGSGKSQLLQYIYSNVALREKRSHDGNKEKQPQHQLYEQDILYYRITDNLGNYSTSSHPTDTSYVISDEETFQQTFTELQEHYKNNRSDLKSPFSKAVAKIITNDLTAGVITESQIDEKYLHHAIIKTIDYNANDIRLSEPIGYLSYVVLQHQKRTAALYTKSTDINNILDLFNYFNTFNEERLKQFYAEHKISLPVEKPQPETFLVNISRNSAFKKALIDSYIHHSIGPSPLKEINDILKRYGFKYTLVNSKDPNSSDAKILFKNGDKIVESNHLSSGEQVMIGMMAWLFHAQGLIADNKNARKVDNKVKIMLLDEPDRHLDPQLCKIFFKIIYDEFVKRQKVQVIMTTHRIDTIALLPNPSGSSSPDVLSDPHIYLIRHQENSTRFIRVTKTHALFRMSHNLRELVDYHHKVYTESATDAKFYEGAYGSLKEKCSEAKLHQPASIDKNHYWILAHGQLPRRLLSNRYQLSFYSVSEKDDKGNLDDKGGGSKVIAAIQQDLTALENLASTESLRGNELAIRWKRSRNFFPNPQLYYSFGVLDYDYDIDHELKPDTKQHIVTTPKRHSLENFLFDPIIFCSSLTEVEIKKCIPLSKINFKKEPGKLKELEDQFTTACINIKHFLEVNDYTSLQAHLDCYFSIIFKTMAGQYKHRPEKKKKPQEKPIYESIFKKSEGKIPLCDTPLEIIGPNNLLFTVLYPNEFLQVRGHDIEEFFWYEYNTENPAERVAKNVYNNGLKFIPLDLADIMFTLNERLRNFVVPVIKPYLSAAMIVPHATLLSPNPTPPHSQQGSENNPKPPYLKPPTASSKP